MSLKLNSSGGGSVLIQEPSTASNVTFTLPSETATAVYANASGNVGIGTSSPATKLNVVGSISASDSTTATKRLQLEVGASSGTINCANYGSDMMDLNIQGENLIFNTGLIGVAEQARITAAGLFQFNSGYGSVATAYGCRAWVNFNGTGTVAIRASGNVSSITDNGTGNYTINFTTAMPDANYSISSTWDQTLASGIFHSENIASTTTSSFNILCSAINNGGATCDPTTLRYAVFR